MTESKLIERLTAFRRTIRLRMVAYGLCAVAAGGVLGFLAITGLDWMLVFPPIPRLITAVIFLVGGVAATMRWVVTPLLKPITLGEIAGKLEEYRWPLKDDDQGMLKDRLRSTIAFLLGHDAGSDELRNQVIANTDRVVRDLRFTDVLSLQPLLSRGVRLAVVLLALAVVELTAPGYAHMGLQRYIYPFGSISWPKNVEIVPLSKDLSVAVGDAVTLRMRVVRGLTPTLRGVVHLRPPGRKPTQLAMRRENENEFVCTVSSITQDLTCWFEAGDDSTAARPLHITVAHRPGVVEALAIIELPEYAQRPERVVIDLLTDGVSATLGSSITLAFRSSKPLETDSDGQPSAWIEIDSEAPLQFHAAESGDAPFDTLEVDLQLEEDIDFHVRLIDDEGFENSTDRQYSIRVKADETPDVTLLEPQSTIEVTPTGSVAIAVRAEDDFGIADLELVGRNITSDEPVRFPLWDETSIVPSGDTVMALSQVAWPLEALHLKPGDAIVLHAEATDNFRHREQGPNIGKSSQRRIKIISMAEFENRLRDELRLLQDQVRKALLSEQTLRDETAILRDALIAQPDATEAQIDEAGRLSSGQAHLAQRLQGLSRRFDTIRQRLLLNEMTDSNIEQQVAHLARGLRATAVGPMSTASRNIAGALETDPESRNSLLAQADVNQTEAIAALSDMIRFMNRWGDFQHAVASTQDLLDKQQALSAATAALSVRTLGKTPEELNEQDQAALRRAVRRQGQLGDETGQLLERLQKLAEQLEHKDPAGADSLDQAIRAAGASDIEMHMNEAAGAIQENRLAGASIDQRNAEAGLNKVLSSLMERQNRELAELAKKVEETLQAVGHLLEEQRSLLEATVEARNLGSGEDVLRRLSQQQHTIKQNALRLADDIHDLNRLPNIAGLVRRSAAPMQEAEEALDNADAPRSEDEQGQAIHLLAEAVRLLEEMADKARQEEEKQALLALKEKLETIRDQQRQINQECGALMELVAQGERLRRKQYRQIAHLARTQTELTPRVSDVRDQLGEAAVYRWVIDRVIESMTISRQGLEARRLDDDLAKEQRHIVDYLEVLIAALAEAAELPSPDEYAESGGGGGGGGSTKQDSPIPSVAELLVLKSMQADINNRTVQLDEDFNSATASEQQLQLVRDLGQEQEKIRELAETVTKRAQQHR